MRWWAVGLLCGLVSPAAAEAQAAAPPGRFEIAAGGLWLAPVSTGSADATETASNGTRFRLFASDSSFGSDVGLEGRVGIRLTRVFQLEGWASHATPELRTRIHADVEGIPDVTLRETLSRWTIEAALVAHLVRWRLGRRTTPFVSAGGGYLRQLHEGGTLAGTGRVYAIGGGVNTLLSPGGGSWLTGAGFRLGARAALRTGGTGDEGLRVAPLVDASFFARF